MLSRGIRHPYFLIFLIYITSETSEEIRCRPKCLQLTCFIFILLIAEAANWYFTARSCWRSIFLHIPPIKPLQVGCVPTVFHPLIPLRLIETSQLSPSRESFVTTSSHNGCRRSRLGEGRARRKPGTLSTPKERGSCSSTTTCNGDVLDRHLVISLSCSRRNGNVEVQYTTGSGPPSDRLEPDRNSAIAAQRDSGKIAEIAGIEETAAKVWRRKRVSTPLAGARGICGRVRRSG